MERLEFRNDAARWPVFRNRILAMAVAGFSIALLTAAGALMFAIPAGLPVDCVAAGVAVLIVLGIMVGTTTQSLNRERQKYFSYVLSIDDTHVRQSCAGLVDVGIAREHVQEIVQMDQYLLHIRGGGQAIRVPKYIAHGEDLLAALEVLQPVRREGGSFFLLRTLLLIFGLCVSMGLLIFALYALLVLFYYIMTEGYGILREKT